MRISLAYGERDSIIIDLKSYFLKRNSDVGNETSLSYNFLYIFFFLSKYPSNNTNVGFETSLEHVFI